jgi:hypothetical protein
LCFTLILISVELLPEHLLVAYFHVEVEAGVAPALGDDYGLRPPSKEIPMTWVKTLGFLIVGAAAAWLGAQAGAALAEEVLPKPPAPFRGKIDISRDKSTPDWPQTVKAPAGAPNIVLVLLDDVGFGATSALGGPVETPKLEKLASNGLR